MLSCQKATELMSMQVEEPLSTRQNLALNLHLTMCRGCRAFKKQVNMIHEACRLFPDHLFKDSL